MGSISRGVLVKGASYSYSYSYATATMWHRSFSIHHHKLKLRSCSSFTTTTRSSLQPPQVSRLAKTAQISLTPTEVGEFGPKIQQVIDWFGQLQAVDLKTIEPSIRAETENNLRDNAPETFDNRDAMVAAVPSYEEPFIKVPKVISMD